MDASRLWWNCPIIMLWGKAQTTLRFLLWKTLHHWMDLWYRKLQATGSQRHTCLRSGGTGWRVQPRGYFHRQWAAVCIPQSGPAHMDKLGVLVSLTSSYRPQSNGQVVADIQPVITFLFGELRRLGPVSEYAKNFLLHSATNLTAFQCILESATSIFMECWLLWHIFHSWLIEKE